MTFKTEKLLLYVVREVFSSDINDVYVCRNMEQPGNQYYTLVMIKQHSIAGQLLRAFERNPGQNFICQDCFSIQESIGFVFPYERERPLTEFYMGKGISVPECEEICIKLVLQCISSGIPPQILYLILSQNAIHIQRDHRIFFSYLLDFASYDDARSEQDCVAKCAEIIVKLLEPCGRKKAKSYDLIRKKMYKSRYNGFMELYKDITLAAESGQKPGIQTKWKCFWEEKKDIVFRILLIICVILLLSALFLLLSQMIFGEVLLFRLFSNPFERIGTESLIK